MNAHRNEGFGTRAVKYPTILLLWQKSVWFGSRVMWGGAFLERCVGVIVERDSLPPVCAHEWHRFEKTS